MCGIAGLVLPPGRKPDERILARMAATMEHRGPDASACVVVGQVGLVHTRLAVVDPTPAGAQPMWSADRSCVLTYNGEVFNHQDLRAADATTAWRGHSDTETVLALLARDGLAALTEFNGLFGLAFLDTRNAVLHLARDRWGVKPLYVGRFGGMLAFASEFEALFAAGLPRRPHATMLREAMNGWVPGPWTPIEGVTRLLPGHSLTLELPTMRESSHRWFAPADLVSKRVEARLSQVTPAQAADLIEDRLRTAVTRRLMSDVPVGTMCSGGVDSSLITALASQQQQVVAYCASVVDQIAMDESPYARMVAAALDVDLRVIPLTGQTWRRDLVATVRHVGYPLTHANSVPMFQIAAAARADGIKVLLSGEGADELFGGYSYLHDRAYRQFAAPSSAPRSAARAVKAWLRDRGWSEDTEPDHLPAVSEEAKGFQKDIVRDAMGAYARHRGPRRRLEAALLADLSLYLPHLLNRQDKTTMQASVETRVPFLDPDVVAAAVNLPLERRIHPDRKWPLKLIAERLLPIEIARRSKMGFGFDEKLYLQGFTQDRFVLHGELRTHLRVSQSEWEEHCATASGLGFLLLWTGEIWCRLYLAGHTDQEVESALWR